MIGTEGLGVAGADGLGATGAEGVLGRVLIGAEGFGETGLLGFEKAGVVGLDSTGANGSLAPRSGPEVVWFGSVPSLLGFSVLPCGLVSIVCGRSLGYLPSEKVCALLLSAGRSTLFSTVVVGAGTFGVGGTFGGMFKYPWSKIHPPISSEGTPICKQR